MACGMCCMLNPQLLEQREKCLAISVEQLNDLEKIVKDYAVRIDPPLKRGQEGFQEHLDKTFPVRDGFDKRGNLASPFKEVLDGGAIPVESIQRIIEETCMRGDGDHNGVVGIIDHFMGTNAAKEWKKASEGTFQQKVEATKKVVAPMVFKALKKHPGAKDRNQFYLQTNLSSSSPELDFMKKRWLNVGNDINERLVDFHGINDPAWRILTFIGGEGNWTPLHVDWTSAENVAFAVSGTGVEVDTDKPVAEWYFFHPSVIPKVDEWIRLHCQGRNGVGLRCGKGNMPFLSRQQFEALKLFCGSDPITGVNYAMRVLQMHGEWISFEPGYLHQVVTLQPSIKFAWDVYKIDLLQRNIEVWMYIICQFMHAEDIANDYMNILNLILLQLLNPFNPAPIAGPTTTAA